MCARDGFVLPLVINGFSVTAAYSREEAGIIDELIDRIAPLYNEGTTAIVFLAGTPGSGKSTLACVLEKRTKERRMPFRLCALGLDGFHLKASVLSSRRIDLCGREMLLKDIKGRPETFNAEGFASSVAILKDKGCALWPVYDRNAHDVSDELLPASGDVFLIEGNWLLYDDERWGKARALADYTIAVRADETELRKRLVERKMRGGKSKREAEEWFENVDGPNVRLFSQNLVSPDFELVLENGMLLKAGIQPCK